MYLHPPCTCHKFLQRHVLQQRITNACRTGNMPLHNWQTSRPDLVVRGFGDELLDYITAGPKLRKWYGEGARIPNDGGPDMDVDDGQKNSGLAEEGPGDAVLVLDADSPTAEQVVLQLILARANVRVLVRNAAATGAAYGAYVTPCQGDAGNAKALEAALKGARAVICTGRLGSLLDLPQSSKLEHLIVLSSAGAMGGSGGFSLGALLDGEAGAQQDPKREAAVRAAPVPTTILRVGQIRDTPGGTRELLFTQDIGRQLGDVSREDVARVLVECLQRKPVHSLVFALESGRPGVPEDLSEALAGLQDTSPASMQR